MKKYLFVFFVTLAGLIGSQIKAQLPATAFDISPLLIGEKAPDIMLTDTKGNQKSLVEITKEKPSVLFFYRGNWCSNCIIHFSEQIAPIQSDILNLGYNMIAVCPDVPDTLLITSQKTKLNSSMFYSDGDGSLTKAMGIAWQQSERSLPRLLAYSGGKNKGFLPVPCVFVLDTNQKIIFEYINPNGPGYQLRVNGKFLLTVLQALK
jgi:peroxiredoxin